MKLKIFSILVSITAVFTFTSCNDWLDVKPEGNVNESTFWQSDDDYAKSTIALYQVLKKESTWGRDLFWEQGATDDIFFSRTRGNSQMNLADLRMDGNTEGSIKSIYSEMYSTMAMANNIINHVLKMENRSAIVDRTLGEAYFMRAFTHFMIAYRYGTPTNGVPFDRYEDYDPYITKIPEQRATVMDNYELIIEDLDKANEHLNWFTTYAPGDYGRATKDAAIALKVKVLAYWAEYDAAKWTQIPSLVDQLENEGGRGLLDHFADVFKIENEWGKEFIWSINSDGSSNAGCILPSMFLDNKGWGRYNGWGNFKPTLELWAEYDEQDARRSATIMQYGDPFVFFGENRTFYSSADLECGFHFAKYMEPFTYGSVDPVSGAGISDKLCPNGDYPVTDLNVPLIRFAEMLLFKAEALIETGEGTQAAQVLNRLTTRAGLGTVYTNATIEDLMHERRCELAGEYTDRLMDLERWATKYPAVIKHIETAKHGLKYLNRSDAASNLDTINGTEMTINGKLYKGVIEIMAAKKYSTKYRVLPYEPNEIIRSNNTMKQNEGY